MIAHVLTRDIETHAVVDWYSVVNIFDESKRFHCRANQKPFDINLNIIQYLFLPYICNQHYTLVVLDFKTRTVVQHNPLVDCIILSDEKMMRGVHNYINTYNRINRTKHNSQDWRIIKMNLLQQTDSISCGIYVLWYIQLYVNKQLNSNLQFSSAKYRHELLKLILVESDSLINACLYCANESKKRMIECFACQRYIDFECLPSNYKQPFEYWQRECVKFMCHMCECWRPS